MPYDMRRNDSEYCVYKAPEGEDAELLKCYADQADAAAYLAALRRAEEEEMEGKTAVAPKKYPLADEGEAWSFTPSDQDAVIDLGGWELYKNVHTWWDNAEGAVPEVKGAYKLPHHKIVGGSVKTVWRGVAAAMAALLGSRGGVDIPSSQKRAVYDHLAFHYKEFEKDVPEYRDVKAEYPDGDEIPGDLPVSYRPAADGQTCHNCEYSIEEDTYDTGMFCGRWQAEVRSDWVCDAWEPAGEIEEEIMDEEKSNLHALKILSETDDKATIGGLAVVYGGQDLQGDTFTADTDYMADHSSSNMPVLFDHALGEVKNTLGVVTKVEERDAGLWFEAQIDRAKSYAAEVLELIKQGKLGYSTGSVAHLVQRLEGHIKRWPIYELSLTPQPAEPRTLGVDFLKTLGLAVPELPGEGTHAIEGAQPKIAEAEAIVIVSDNVKTNMETIMSEDVKTTETQPEPEVKAPEAIQQPDIKAMIASAINDIAADRATESGGILTDAPATKKVTALGGDHDGIDAFKHWCRTGEDNYYTKAALQEGSATEGGVLVPEGLYDRIIAKRDEASVPHRSGALVINTGLDSVQVPSENATGGFALTAEEGAFSQDEPTFNSNVVSVYKFTNLTKVSDELLADDQTDLEPFLADMWGRGLAAMYNYYTLIGNGSGEPQGVFAAGGGTAGLTLAGAAAITAAEVVELYHTLGSYYSEGAVWTTRNSTLGAIRGLTGNPFLFNPTPMGDAPYGDLYSKRVLLSDSVSAMASGVKCIMVGNWSFYALVERSGLVVSRNPYLYQLNGQVGFFVNARWGGDVLQAEAFQYATNA